MNLRLPILMSRAVAVRLCQLYVKLWSSLLSLLRPVRTPVSCWASLLILSRRHHDTESICSLREGQTYTRTSPDTGSSDDNSGCRTPIVALIADSSDVTHRVSGRPSDTQPMTRRLTRKAVLRR